MSMTAAPPLKEAREAAPSDSRIAAIDVGSNSLHMIIAQVDPDGAATTLWRLKEMVGLGRSSFPSHRLSDEAMDRAILALKRFGVMANRRGSEKLVAVATSAVREAENGGDFIERARREAGVNIRIVTAREEARLIYLGVRHAMDFTDGANLIVDIGGGSVEFIVANSKEPLLMESRKLGAARMTAKFISDDPPKKKQVEGLLEFYQSELSQLFAQLRKFRPSRVIGTSGTLENLAEMCGAEKSKEEGGRLVIGRSQIQKLAGKLLKTTAEERVKIRGLDEKRQDQIIAGVLLVRLVMEELDIEQIVLCDSALREGILLDYVGRHLPDLQVRKNVPDPRRRSVLDLARKCEWNETHSSQVARIALKLFDELHALHKLQADARELIEFAAMLHDIGWHISPQRHHKHSQYLITYGDLKGFEDREVAIVANIARYHRRAMPKASHETYAKLSKEDRFIVDVGASLLRVADGLDRTHSRVVNDLQCKIRDDRVKVVLASRGDMELELWAARRKTDLFIKTFDRAVVFRPAD